MGASCEGRLDTEIRTSSWETGEGSGTHNDEAEVILISDGSKAHFSTADVRPDNQTVWVSEVNSPGAGSNTHDHDDDVVLPPNPGDGMGHFSDAFKWFVDLTGSVSGVVPPGEGTPSAFSLSEVSNMFRRHHLLGFNRCSPLFEMGLDMYESVTPRLIWDVSFASGKGEDAYNFLDVAPLAPWDPDGGLNLVT